MKGKTRDEAKAELVKEGVSGQERLEAILPHKVTLINILYYIVTCTVHVWFL